MLWSTLLSLATFNLIQRPAEAPRGASTAAHLTECRSSLAPHLKDFVEGFRTRYGVTSIGVATVRRGNDSDGVWERAIGVFGTAHVGGDPVTSDSLFSIASNTKFFTMLSVGMLIENGTRLPNGDTLGWNTKMKDIFPDLAFPDASKTQMLDIIDLMSMRSGMPRHDGALGMFGYEEVIKSFPHVKASSEIRQTWQYNNWHYVLLSGIIPTLTGVPYHDFVQRNFFDPLNMTSSFLNATAAGETGRWTDGSMRIGMNMSACRAQWTAKGKVDERCLGRTERFGRWTESNSLPMGGAGGSILSLTDMTKWIRELLDPKVISPSLIDKAGHAYSVAQIEAEYPELGVETYGLAQITFTYRGHKVVTHSGGLPGQNSLLLRLVDDGFGIFITTNEQDLAVQMLYTIGYRFLDDHLGLEPIDWETRYLSKALGSPADYTLPPERPVPSPREEEVVGKYHHPVYGVLDLQLLSVEDASSEASGLTEAAFESKSKSTTIYIAPVNKLFTNYVAFSPFSGNVFNWTGALAKVALNEDRSKSDTVAGLTERQSGSCVITDDGIGMFGNFWGAGSEVQVQHAEVGMKHVKERAEVWFDKQK